MNLYGSAITCLSEGFVPGQAFTWNFTLVNQGTSDEFINQVKMDLPEGIKVNGISDFSGGSLGDLVFQESAGDSSTIIWQGFTPGGTGVIQPGDTATAVISGFTDKSFMDDVFLVYSIRSDSTGGGPHKVSGYIRLNNRSLPNTWLTLGRTQGRLFRGKTDTLFVNMDAHGLSSGYYNCKIIIKDGFNNNLVIPVTMHVIDTNNNVIPNIDGNLLISGYPNPFTLVTHIEYEIQKTGQVQARVSDIYGKNIKTLVSGTRQAGRYRLTWNGENDSGERVSPGVYYCTLRTGDKTGTLKLILIR